MNAADLEHRYREAASHAVHMPVADAEALSRLLAARIEAEVGRPDLLVGLADGALLVTRVCAEALGVPAEMVRVRRRGSRLKRRLAAVKETLRIPSRWVLAGPLRALWVWFQERTGALEEEAGGFGFEVRGRHVVVLDDCAVSGASLRHVAGRIRALGAARVSTAVLCWTEAASGGGMTEAPDVHLHRRIQWYPWSDNSEHRPAYRAWLQARGLARPR